MKAIFEAVQLILQGTAYAANRAFYLLLGAFLRTLSRPKPRRQNRIA